MIKPKQDVFVQKGSIVEDGKEKERDDLLIFHLGKPIANLNYGKYSAYEGLQAYLITEIGGVDAIKQLSIHCFQVLVGQCFDGNEVSQAIREALKSFMSDIEVYQKNLKIIK